MPEIIRSMGDLIIRLYESAGLLSVPVVITGVVLFLLQRRFPVSTPFKGSSATSAGWTLLIAPVTAVVVGFEFAALTRVFESPLTWSGFETMQTWPIAVRVMIGLLVVDFIDWWSHKLRHRVPLLWRFHTIHHSAPYMTFWASLRSHPVDVIIGSTVLAIPFILIRESAMVFGLVIGIRTVLFYFHHSNVRVRLGRLDAIFVTPQWHRIHHSTEVQHYDTNFGATLTIWDRMFGTAFVPGSNDFPEIGLDAELCPPDAERLTGVPRALINQVIFPFRAKRGVRASSSIS